jgi:hypothetical protein
VVFLGGSKAELTLEYLQSRKHVQNETLKALQKLAKFSNLDRKNGVFEGRMTYHQKSWKRTYLRVEYQQLEESTKVEIVVWCESDDPVSKRNTKESLDFIVRFLVGICRELTLKG